MENQPSVADKPTWSKTCTTLDHIYPVTKFGRTCYCGARIWGGKPAAPVSPLARLAPPSVVTQPEGGSLAAEANDVPAVSQEPGEAVWAGALMTGSSPAARAADVEQSDREFIAARQAAEKTDGGTQKGLDTEQQIGVILTEQIEPRGARPAETGPTSAPPTKDRTVNLTLKGQSKNGKQAMYGGAKQVLRFPVGVFVGGTAPQSFDVPDGVFEAPVAKTPKVKLTPEERKAARAAKPKPTLA